MIEQTIMEFARTSPDFTVGIEEITNRLSSTPIVAEDLLEAIEMLEMALQDPVKYPEIVQAALADGLIDPGDAPEEFNAEFIIALLIALYGLRDELNAQGFARGGLTVAGRKLANQGQGGDSMIAHINPREAEILKRMGGQGTINPNTGIQEYKSLKKIIKTVIPVALMVFGGPMATAIGSSLGLSGTAAAVVGNAALQAGSAALTGGDPLKAAIMGGVSGGLGSVAGGFVNDGLNLGLSAPVAATLGSGLVGGAAGAITGDGFAKGALQGVGGQLLKNLAPGTPGAPTNAFEAALQSGASTTGNMLPAGYTPKESITGGVTSGIFAGAKNYLKPSTAVVADVQNQMPSSSDMIDFSNNADVGFDLASGTDNLINLGSGENLSGVYNGQQYVDGVSQGAAPPTVTTGGANVPVEEVSMFKKLGNYAVENPLATAALTLTAASALEAPPDVEAAVTTLSPEQQEYFNKPLVSWDWDKMRLDANNANMTLGSFMAYNMPTISQGYYNAAPTGNYRGGAIRMNTGGLNQMSRYVRGPGTGRSDEIPAYLSDGEYVIDAETVALLGDGSNKAGASVLNDMRKSVRKHKGSTLAKGGFSKDAKSPLEYMRGVA